jgi:hypothetical protein
MCAERPAALWPQPSRPLPLTPLPTQSGLRNRSRRRGGWPTDWVWWGLVSALVRACGGGGGGAGGAPAPPPPPDPPPYTVSCSGSVPCTPLHAVTPAQRPPSWPRRMRRQVASKFSPPSLLTQPWSSPSTTCSTASGLKRSMLRCTRRGGWASPPGAPWPRASSPVRRPGVMRAYGSAAASLPPPFLVHPLHRHHTLPPTPPHPPTCHVTPHCAHSPPSMPCSGSP